MQTKKFKLHHLFLGIAALLAVEALLMKFFASVGMHEAVILLASIIGSILTLYVSVEAIEEVRNKSHLIVFLSLIVIEFIVLYAFQYGFLLKAATASFPTLSPDALSLLLHSTMVFVFNPLNVPGTSFGRLLLLVNTLSALSLAMFILQNIWQLRSKLTK